jgi:hypothetical protein
MGYKVAFKGIDCHGFDSYSPMNSLLSANISCLRQGIDFLDHLPPALFRKKCPGVFNSTIGGHFRHNLDHYAAFIKGYSTGRVDYDDRGRNRETELDPEAARKQLGSQLDRLSHITEKDLEKALQIRMDDGGESAWSRTTVRRELQFLLSHTIHHYALVVSISTANDYNTFPPKFGVAPSTIHFQEEQGVG